MDSQSGHVCCACSGAPSSAQIFARFFSSSLLGFFIELNDGMQ